MRKLYFLLFGLLSINFAIAEEDEPTVAQPLPPLVCGSGTASVLYSEDFEAGFPTDWTNTAVTNPQWFTQAGFTSSALTGPSTGFSGTSYIYLECSGGALGDTDTLTPPSANLTSTVDAARVSWAYHMYGADMGNLAFEISTDGVNYTEIWSESGQVQTSEAAAWIEVELDLTAYVGNIVDMRFVGTRGVGFTSDMAIDLFQVEACISCPGPTLLNTSNVTTTTVDLDWTNGGTETNWIMEFGPTGFTPGTGTQVGSFNNPETLTGLIDNTDYDIYVYADCGGGDTSIPVGPVSISTAIACPAPTAMSFTYTSNDTAAITWTPGGLEAAWIVEYGTGGYTPGTGTQSNVTIVPDTTFGLVNGNIYDFYIQADCGSGVNNPWFGPIQYATPILNDDECSPINVLVDGSTTYFANVGATENVGEPTAGFNTAWFTFTAPPSGHVEISTCGTDFNNMLEVYEVFTCTNYGSFIYKDGATGNPFVTCQGVDPAGLNMCDLIPGNTYYIVVGGETALDEGIFPLTLTEIPPIFSGDPLPLDVCNDVGVFDLFSTIENNETTGGTWYNPVVAPGNVFASTIDLTGTPVGEYPFFYLDMNQCDDDTTETSITIHELPSLGNGGIITQVCDYETVNLFTGLSGTITLGGIWKDINGDTLVDGLINYTGAAPGIYNHWYVIDNGGCPADSSIVNVQLIDCAGFGEFDLLTAVYPNPVKDNLNIQFNANAENVTIQLLSINGQLIESLVTLNGKIATIDVSDLAAGVYFLKISSDELSQSVKVVKQ
ncbi:MAG: hypothetical protein ACI857_000167 [Arenicella sp.]|jgi:hypothetical protein